MIRVLLVENRSTIRQGLRMRLAIEEDIAVVGETGCGEGAARLAARLRPDVVLLDSETAESDGLACAAAVRDAAPNSALVLLTLRSDSPTRTRAAAAGVAACVETCEADTALLPAIRQAAGQAPTGANDYTPGISPA